MMQEDLTMKAVNDSANHQTLLYGMGDQHIDIIVSKLLETLQSRSRAVPSEGSLPRDDPQKFGCRSKNTKNSPAATASTVM